MSVLKPGTLCVIIAGCPANIGVVVEVLARLGAWDGYADAYHVRTASGRPFAQLWDGNGPDRRLHPGPNPSDCVTERNKLRPLVDPKVGAEGRSKAAGPTKSRARREEKQADPAARIPEQEKS